MIPFDQPRGFIDSAKDSPLSLWSLERAASPLVGTAIHNGHGVRDDLAPAMALDDAGRLREEDPFTEYAIRDVPNRIVFHRSRFEIDLNRSKPDAVYVRPDQAWGLNVWKERLPENQIAASRAIHDAYYAMLKQMLAGIEAMHGGFVLLDIHSYNHRREGPDSPPTDPDKAPVVNIGTFSMDRGRWQRLLDPLIETLAGQTLAGAPIDVRENIAFQGKGEQTRFVHEHFPKTGCAIAIEFKKVFMDEWRGIPDHDVLEDMRRAIAATLPGLQANLEVCL